MLRKKIHTGLLVAAISICQIIQSQTVDSTSFKLYSRFSFYSFEKNGEFLLHVPSGLTQSPVEVTITTGGDTITSWKGRPGRSILRIPFTIDLPASDYKVECRIKLISGYRVYLATTDLRILIHKPNEVKTDRLTGGLIVNSRPFFPFGFYCYSPVPPALPEEEVTRGFNMISPYQTILPETLSERKAYMDRCASLGMKVHYNLLSLAGEGGVDPGINGPGVREKKARLIEEIKTFMDHPALLAWYISDEPNGTKVPPESLEEIYSLVRQIDPWHPVSIVFMAPFLASKEYANALDIVMADPYPVPNYPIGMTGDVTGQLKSEFTGKKSVWMVLQAFGGGEWWGREPTLQELRSMTWQSIIRGATGIQYFVRQGPDYFPKSVAAWNECGRMAMEVAEITPWLLSDEEPLKVESSSPGIIVSSKVHDNRLLIMAVNKINRPAPISIRIVGIYNGTAGLMFEDRSVQIDGGIIKDYISPYGSLVYLIDLKPGKKILTGPDNNLIKDPGFEESVNPGVPSACYARPGGDKGATYFLDTREHHEGDHSLRLITPVSETGVSLRLYPFTVKAGASYAISIWAKSDPEQRLSSASNGKNESLYLKKSDPQYVEIELGAFGGGRFVPGSEWRRYMTFITIPADTLASFRTNLMIKMPGQGIAWFDEMKVFEEKVKEDKR